MPGAPAVQQAASLADPALDSALDLSPLTPGPISTSVSAACDSAAAIVRQTLALEMRRQEGSFKDSFRNEPRQGCRLVALGSFKALGADVGPIDTLRAVFPRRGWAPDVRYEADGPDGSDIGMRKLETLCIIGGSWDGGDDSDTTTRAPTPEEDQYGIKVECVHDVPINSAEDVPDSIWSIARAAGLDSAYAFSFRSRYPPWTLGDFDGDGISDAAVVVEQRATGKAGVVFVHRGTRKVYIVGAGTRVAGGPDDFSWADDWEVFHAGDSFDSVIRDHPGHVLSTDALWLSRRDSASGFLFWNGNGYSWEARVTPAPVTPITGAIVGRQLKRPP
ncbi:MAG TPA: hypothetical protein VF159_01210 [Gemmatimonadaceae bacterium]